MPLADDCMLMCSFRMRGSRSTLSVRVCSPQKRLLTAKRDVLQPVQLLLHVCAQGAAVGGLLQLTRMARDGGQHQRLQEPSTDREHCTCTHPVPWSFAHFSSARSVGRLAHRGRHLLSGRICVGHSRHDGSHLPRPLAAGVRIWTGTRCFTHWMAKQSSFFDLFVPLLGTIQVRPQVDPSVGQVWQQAQRRERRVKLVRSDRNGPVVSIHGKKVAPYVLNICGYHQSKSA